MTASWIVTLVLGADYIAGQTPGEAARDSIALRATLYTAAWTGVLTATFIMLLALGWPA